LPQKVKWWHHRFRRKKQIELHEKGPYSDGDFLKILKARILKTYIDDAILVAVEETPEEVGQLLQLEGREFLLEGGVVHSTPIWREQLEKFRRTVVAKEIYRVAWSTRPPSEYKREQLEKLKRTVVAKENQTASFTERRKKGFQFYIFLEFS
jgi:hypothetical protein